jgi:hypothetical protein
MNKRRLFFLTRSYLPEMTGGTLIRSAQVKYLEANYEVFIITPNFRSNDFEISENIHYVPFPFHKVPGRINMLLEKYGILEDYLDSWIWNAKRYLAYYRDSAALEPVHLCQCRRAGAQALVLAPQNRRHVPAPLVGIGQAPGNFAHRLDRWRMRVERLYGGKIIDEIEEKFGLMGQLAEGKGATIHEPLDEPRAKTSHQFPVIWGQR